MSLSAPTGRTTSGTRNATASSSATCSSRAGAISAMMAAPPQRIRMRKQITARYFAMTRLAALLLIRGGTIPRCALLVCLLTGSAGVTLVSAQKPDDLSIPGAPAALRNLKIDRGGGVHLTRHFAVVF